MKVNVVSENGTVTVNGDIHEGSVNSALAMIQKTWVTPDRAVTVDVEELGITRTVELTSQSASNQVHVVDVNNRIDPSPFPRSEESQPRRSFLDEQDFAVRAEGMQKILAKIGIQTKPTEKQLRKAQEELLLAQHWPGARTIAIANAKGGANKTPTVVALSALFARYGGNGVVAADFNITSGSLGWRTQKGPHNATMANLLEAAPELMLAHAQIGDLDHYVHHQGLDQYDVVQSNPEQESSEQILTQDEFDSVHAVLSKYYRMVFLDTGNDEGATVWSRAMHHANQLVVATTTRRDSLEAARVMLDRMRKRDEHQHHLADHAVIIISQADRDEAGAEIVAQTFREMGYGRDVLTIPYDRGMRKDWLYLDVLKKRTIDAWRTAAAAVAKGL